MCWWGKFWWGCGRPEVDEEERKKKSGEDEVYSSRDSHYRSASIFAVKSARHTCNRLPYPACATNVLFSRLLPGPCSSSTQSHPAHFESPVNLYRTPTMFGPLGLSLAPIVRKSPTLLSWTKPFANWYMDKMGYRKVGFKYDDLRTFPRSLCFYAARTEIYL